MDSPAATLLGIDITSGSPVLLEQENRLKGLYIIGKTGSGKTTLLVNLILQDIEQGMGVCFLCVRAQSEREYCTFHSRCLQHER